MPLDHSERENSEPTATLWIIATPIGNLGDISTRALDLLRQVPVIAAEDTRVSQKLVPSRAKPPRWISLHDHNEVANIEQLLIHLQNGQDVALVSDAGTPLISDPGYRLVSAAHDQGIRVSPIPGPNAAIAALSAAGLATDRFSFEGFLPAKRSARISRLRNLSERTETQLFYVPARDLAEVLQDMLDTLGPDRIATIARELTKQFETVRRDPIEDLLIWVQADSNQLRGESVVITSGANLANNRQAIEASALAFELAQELAPARAARLLARLSGMDRREAFSLIERLRKT